MKAPNLVLPKSQLTFSVSLFILLAVFFIGYFFYYIPVNKDDIYKNGFLILENISKSIQERNEGIKIMSKGYLAPGRSAVIKQNVNNVQELLDNNHVKGKVFNINKSSSVLNRKSLSDSFISNNAADGVILKNIIDGNLVYISNNSNADSIGIAIPFESIVLPVLQPQKNELFESYMVIDKNGLVYKDPELGIGENIVKDSLFADNKTVALTTVKDIKIEGVGYKMFSYPLKLGMDEIVLFGFVKTKKYNERIHEIPVSFIYPIVIIFILLVIFLPIIKFYVMGPDEHVRFIDIALGALSFFVGAPLITLTLIQVLMLWAADIRAKENLDVLSAQIDSSFRKELADSYQKLDFLDTLVTQNITPASLLRLKAGENVDVSDSIKKYYLTNIKDTALYYDIERVSWIDKSGRQRIKGQSIGGLPVFVDVSERNYFKTLKNNEGYMVPGHPGATFAIEPVNNWVNGEFQIVLSKKSIFDNDYYTTLATRMHSVTETILPPGYGFCIIDKAGKVQFHSEMNRNLQENIVEKIAPSRQIKESINSRQQNYFTDLKFYGKTNALNIESISKTPFYLITYCDKGYIVPINMRVFTFALLFSCFTFLICSLIWVVVFRNRYYSYPMLYSPMVFLKWLNPRESASQFYVLGARLLLVYIFMLIFFMVLAPHFNLSDYVIMVLILLFPVNVISGLFVLSYSTANIGGKNLAAKESGKSIKALTPIFFQLILSLLVYGYSEMKNYPIGSAFLCFQVLVNLLMWLNYFFPRKWLSVLAETGLLNILHYFFPRKWLSVLSKSKKNYLVQFSWLASLLIICMAVLPAGLYSWYAHNQEITQSIKKEQLYLAESLQKRRGQINKLIIERDTLNPSFKYYDKALYHSGIYKIYKDSIIENADQFDSSIKKDSYEKFYFAIAKDIGNNYYDPLLLPALEDSVKDNAWHWIRHDTTLSFWYNLGADVQLNGANSNTLNKSLKIISVYPDRYKYTNLSIRGILLFLFILALICGLFLLLRSLTERIFLKKFISIAQKSSVPENKITNLCREFSEKNNYPFEEIIDETRDLQKEHNIYVPGGTSAEIYDQEKQMIGSIEKLKPFYEFIWQKFSYKERYLLLDFAQDGLANYKNTAVIYSLLGKGIFIIHNGEVKLFSASFRAYLLTKRNTPEIYELQQIFRQNSAWQSFRRPLLILLLGLALFIFFTQEQTFQKIMALVAGTSSVLSLLVKFFVDGAGGNAAKK